MLAKLGLLPEHSTLFPHESSAGHRQRICIAPALAHSPSLLVAEEAVSALDVSIQAPVVNLLLETQAELRLATFSSATASPRSRGRATGWP